MKRLKVIVTAYTVDPSVGSEAGMGWAFSKALSEFCEVEVFTRKNNRRNIEIFMLNNDMSGCSLRFSYFDLPSWILKIKKKGGILGSQAYYMLWNFFLALKLKHNKSELSFDIFHALNLHTDWITHFLYICSNKKPIIWGPIGHHEKIPDSYLSHYSHPLTTRLAEKIKLIIKEFSWKLSPLTKLSFDKSHIILMDLEHGSRYKYLLKSCKSVNVIPSVATKKTDEHQDDLFEGVTKIDEFIVLTAGRQIPLKGFELAIDAYISFCHKINYDELPKVVFKVVGKGPLRKKLENQYQAHKNFCRIEFIDWLEHSKMQKLMSECDIFLFPSFEGAGMVVAEAMLNKTHVICLNNTGPSGIAEGNCLTVDYNDNLTQTIDNLSSCLLRLYSNKTYLEEQKSLSKKFAQENLSWARRKVQLERIYTQISEHMNNNE